jgi:glycine betaine/proline transport system substrate-binding protein
MRAPKTFRTAALAVAGLMAATSLAACGGRDSDTAAAAENTEASSAGASADKSVTIGMAAGWAEDIAVSHLWKHVLEEEGYDVTLKELDVAPVFVGVAEGDLDLFFDTWLPVTHEDYWKKYGDQVADLGVWYDSATLNIAVPEYVDAKTIGDLKGMADTFDGEIIGIDPGAGLTRVTQDEAMPAYGLDDYQLKTSSSTAMLAALKKATDEKKPVVVTLWHPHWAYSAFPIKDLEDPKGAMGDAEEIHTIASTEFADGNTDLISSIKNFKMDDATLADLEKVVLQEHEGDLEAGVDAWVEDNQDFVDAMIS